MIEDDQNLLGYYLEQAVCRLNGYVKKGEVMNFRCPVCGDSQISSLKKRAYVYPKNGEWYFFCHNLCGGSKANFWLKKNFKEEYNQYSRDLFLGFKRSLSLNNVNTATFRTDYETTFKPIIGDLKINKDAIDLCNKRLIPERYWSKFFICYESKLAGRMIIPFYDKDGNYTFYQGRALYGSEPKYMSKPGSEKEMFNVKVYNKEEKHLVVEGPIDAMFLENSIALVGANVNEELLKNCDVNKTLFLLDDDKTGRKKSRFLLERGFPVFLWDNFLKDLGIERNKNVKIDINDVVVKLNKKNGFTVSELLPYFTKDVLQKVDFL